MNNTLHKIAKNISFLCSVPTATYLAAYIVDLTLVLFEISKEVLALTDHPPPKTLSTNLVMKALAQYKSKSVGIHAQVKEVAVSHKLEIANVIRDALPIVPK